VHGALEHVTAIWARTSGC